MKCLGNIVSSVSRSITPSDKDGALGKPTIKLEFESNDELLAFQDSIKESMPQTEPIVWNSEKETFDPGVSGLTINDKPAAVFNCSESQLNCKGFVPTYKILPSYDHLIDKADGAKTLKGYGFEDSTLYELINACKYYKQVERLAEHLKGDTPMQSAFNIWHWLHTNVRYNYDTPGEEEIRTPARTWADRHTGVDCDCLAVFTACLLICMGYKPKFEIVGFGNSNRYSHIYVTLDGQPIDRVLPVFLARPPKITRWKIMDIPVYELSGIGACGTLAGLYENTLRKIYDGTATTQDNVDFRKTQVLVTLQGIDEDAYKLAALLMPHIVTVDDDGTYYFDTKKMANVARKLDAELALVKSQNVSPEYIQQWFAAVIDELDGVSTTADADDTIVVIINPKGDTFRISGQMAPAQLQTLSPMSASNAATSAAVQSPVLQTTPAPTVSPEEKEDSNTALWIVGGIASALGLTALFGNKKKKKRK